MDLFSSFIGKVVDQTNPGIQQSPQGQVQQDREPGVKLPSEILQVIGKYVDTFKPGISGGIASEIEAFEKATIGALEQHIKTAIVGVFKGDSSSFQSNSNIQQFAANRQSGAAGMPQHNYPPPNVVTSRGQGGDLPEYGGRGLPFAAAGTKVAAEAPEAPDKNKSVFEQALGKVTSFAKDAAEDIKDDAEREVKDMASKIGDIAEHIDEKVDSIIPDIKAKVGELLDKLHLGLAEKMTEAAISEVKKFLGSNVSVDEIKDVAVEGLELIGGLLGGAGLMESMGGHQGGGGGAIGLLSNKLSEGLTHIRRAAREAFRTFLSEIEEHLFNLIPDSLKTILQRIFGGNPDGSPGILGEIAGEIAKIFERLLDAVRDRVLEITGGGHRRLEDAAWGNVQDAIVTKVQKYAPGVQVRLEDDDDQQRPGQPQQQPQQHAQQQRQQDYSQQQGSGQQQQQGQQQQYAAEGGEQYEQRRQY